MNKEKLFKKHDADFLPLGFVKDDKDPQFHYEYKIIPDEVIEENDLVDDEVPVLVFGLNDTGILGFALYTGASGAFIWTSLSTPKEAIEWVKKIVSFDD